MTTAIATIPFNDMERMAEAMAQSGLFGMKQATQALALMLVAQAEGQHPATIAQDYDIIQGKATRKTHSVLARFQSAGGRVEWHQLTEAIADATFSHAQGGTLRMTWTFDQAKKAGLVGKDNWKNYPRAMLRARCIAEGVRAVYPAAIGGMLVAEEAMDMPVVRNMGMAEVVGESTYVDPSPILAGVASIKTDDEGLKYWKENAPKLAKRPTDYATLKDAVIARRLAIKNEAKPDTNAPPVVTYASVMEKLLAAKNIDALDVAADWIGEVPDSEHRAELSLKYDEIKNSMEVSA